MSNQKVCNYYGELLNWGTQFVPGGWFTPEGFKDKVAYGCSTHFMCQDGSIWTYATLKVGLMGAPEGGPMVMVAPPDAARVLPRLNGADWPAMPDLVSAKPLSPGVWYIPQICHLPASGAFTWGGCVNFQPVVVSAAFPGLHFMLDEVWPVPHGVEMDPIPLV